MTDTSKALERIWAWPDSVEDGFMAASHVGEPPTEEYEGSHTLYIRADLSGWRDIESAPKDGRCILVAHGYSDDHAGAFVAYWSSSANRWQYSVGRFVPNPAFWMHLPAAPEASE